MAAVTGVFSISGGLRCISVHSTTNPNALRTKGELGKRNGGLLVWETVDSWIS